MLVFLAVLGVAAGAGAWVVLGGDPPPPEGLTDCEQLLVDIRAFGRAGGRAIFARRIQHGAAHRGAGESGMNWIGAIVGAISGTGEAADRLAAAERECGDRLQEAATAHRDAREAIHDAFDACKAGCKAANPDSFGRMGRLRLGPRGKPYRDCVDGCRAVRKASRREMRGGTGSAVGQWMQSFLPGDRDRSRDTN